MQFGESNSLSSMNCDLEVRQVDDLSGRGLAKRDVTNGGYSNLVSI